MKYLNPNRTDFILFPIGYQSTRRTIRRNYWLWEFMSLSMENLSVIILVLLAVCAAAFAQGKPLYLFVNTPIMSLAFVLTYVLYVVLHVQTTRTFFCKTCTQRHLTDACKCKLIRRYKTNVPKMQLRRVCTTQANDALSCLVTLTTSKIKRNRCRMFARAL